MLPKYAAAASPITGVIKSQTRNDFHITLFEGDILDSCLKVPSLLAHDITEVLKPDIKHVYNTCAVIPVNLYNSWGNRQAGT